MRFVLTINLENEAMSTGLDLTDALERTASRIPHNPTPGDSGSIYDQNGNRVGNWRIESTGDES